MISTPSSTLSGIFKEVYEDKLKQIFTTQVILGPQHGFVYKKNIRKVARLYWAKYVRQHGVNIKVFTKKAEDFYNAEDIGRKMACQKARNVLCYEQQLKDILK